VFAHAEEKVGHHPRTASPNTRGLAQAPAGHERRRRHHVHAGRHMEPDWKLEHGYQVEIDGAPRVRTNQILPPHGFSGKSFEDFLVLGMIATALPAVHAIPAVCAAWPGIVTYADLLLVTAAHCVR
jgi:hypothetical protein